MTLRTRFLLSLLAVIAIMVVPAVYGLTRVAELRNIALDLREQAAISAIAVGRLATAIEQFDRFQRLYVADPAADYSEEYADAMWARMQEAQDELALLEEAGYGDAVAAAGVPLTELSQVTARLDALVSGGLLEAATEYRIIAADPLIQRALESVPALADAIERHTAIGVAAAQRSADATTAAVTTATIIALIFAAALALAAAGVLSSPLNRLAGAMAKVADGVFDAPRGLPYERSDEVGDLARSFRAMTVRLAQLDRMKAEFVGAASHGLKTPIGVIGGYAELIQEEANGNLTGRQRELLDALAEQTDVLRRRLDQLLEISRMESGELTLGLEEIYLRHFVNELQREYSPAAEKRGIRLSVSLDEHTQPFIIADPDVLRVDVFANLIGNAIKYSPVGGTVEIAVRPDRELVVFDVIDSGPGIPPDQLDRVFEKYYQGRDAGGGSGLGLAIAQAAVLAHGGRIGAQNLPGRGARFRVVLPAAPSSPVDQRQAKAADVA